MAVSLHQDSLSLRHRELAELLSTTENLLVIQDLDGVCMGLVEDPLTRTIDPEYVAATQAFDGRFYVLTNGEHVGTRGVNAIVERSRAAGTRDRGGYLPGLAAGGVQWQDRDGNVAYPGVSETELAFLREVPQRLRERLQRFCDRPDVQLSSGDRERCVGASVLDNEASPTANLNTFYRELGDRPQIYLALQREMERLMQELLADAIAKGLQDSFFRSLRAEFGSGRGWQRKDAPGRRQRFRHDGFSVHVARRD